MDWVRSGWKFFFFFFFFFKSNLVWLKNSPPNPIHHMCKNQPNSTQMNQWVMLTYIYIYIYIFSFFFFFFFFKKNNNKKIKNKHKALHISYLVKNWTFVNYLNIFFKYIITSHIIYLNYIPNFQINQN